MDRFFTVYWTLWPKKWLRSEISKSHPIIPSLGMTRKIKDEAKHMQSKKWICGWVLHRSLHVKSLCISDYYVCSFNHCHVARAIKISRTKPSNSDHLIFLSFSSLEYKMKSIHIFLFSNNKSDFIKILWETGVLQ